MTIKDKIINKIGFTALLGFSAIIIAFCSAYYSTFGIANLFKGSFISVAIMASSLELGKLVAATFLFRYWKKAQKIIKMYLTAAVIILVLITSLGIYGYLSSAYQSSALEFKSTQDKIVLIESQKPYFVDKIDQSRKRIDILNQSRALQESRLSESLTNEFLSRNPIQLKQIQQQTIDLIDTANKDIKSENDKIQSSIDELQSIDNQVGQLKLNSLSKKDIQTFTFVADALKMDLNKLVNIFILTIIFVFDPLALALILAYNIVIYDPSLESLDKIASTKSNIQVEKENTQLLQSVFDNVPETTVTESIDDKKKLKWYQRLMPIIKQ
jgi:hypothetical protein